MPRDKVPKTRAPNPTAQLARWFVEEILGRKWDYRSGGVHLKNAKMLINPAPDPETGEKPKVYKIEDVQDCLLRLKAGEWGQQQVRSLLWVLYGEPPHIERLIPGMPSVHEGVSFDAWVREFGKKAIDEETWDGVYRAWDGRHRTPEGPFGIKEDELCSLLGEEAAVRSLTEYYNRRNKCEKSPATFGNAMAGKSFLRTSKE